MWKSLTSPLPSSPSSRGIKLLWNPEFLSWALFLLIWRMNFGIMTVKYRTRLTPVYIISHPDTWLMMVGFMCTFTLKKISAHRGRKVKKRWCFMLYFNPIQCNLNVQMDSFSSLLLFLSTQCLLKSHLLFSRWCWVPFHILCLFHRPNKSKNR